MDKLLQQANQLLHKIDLAAVADILIVTLLVYGLLSLLQGTRANQVLRGAIILLLSLFLVSSIFHLPMVGWLVSNSLPALFLVAAVIFAPELRRALEQIGHTGDLFQRPLSQHSRDSLLLMINEVCDACVYLSSQRWGALIVIERDTGLQDLIVNGQIIDGRVSSSLLSTIFRINSELHDGAVVIQGDRIVAAHVTLPLAEDFGARHHLGHRHKAALGITEETDAIAVIVSEETGNISVANGGQLLQRLTKDKLRQVLISLLDPSLLQEKQKSRNKISQVTNRLTSRMSRNSNWHRTFGNRSDNRIKVDSSGNEEAARRENDNTTRPDNDTTSRRDSDTATRLRLANMSESVPLNGNGKNGNGKVSDHELRVEIEAAEMRDQKATPQNSD